MLYSAVSHLKVVDGVIEYKNWKTKIKACLAQDESIDKIKPILNVPILLLYECEETKNQTTLTDEYKNKIIEIHKDRATAYFKKQIEKCKGVHLYEKINFHIILFPVADKQKIVDTFILKAKAHRE